MSAMEQRPNYRCGFCGEGVACEHGYCNICQCCIECTLADIETESNCWVTKSKHGGPFAKGETL